MEQLEKKNINGRTYYYYSKWGWRNGRCRRLWQKYLGKIETIVKAVEGDLFPQHAEVFNFGLPAALWQECRRQDIIGTVNRICRKRKQGLSLGHYITLAGINRAILPTSKNGMWEWFCSTALRRFLPEADESALSSKRFWDQMNNISPQQAKKCWSELIANTLQREDIDLSEICYDSTNFFTFVDTFNVRCSTAKRGKNKQGRNNLKQISYSLFCTQQHGIPLFYDVYEGNRNDAAEFPKMIEGFSKFLNSIAEKEKKPLKPRVTVVFDKGNNSDKNIRLLDKQQLQFIGALKLNEHKQLADISNNDKRFQQCERSGLESLRVIRLQKKLHGKERTVLVTFNQELFDTQLKTVNEDINKAMEKLEELKRRLDDRASGLIKGGRSPTRASITKQCNEIRSRPYMKQLLPVEITDDLRLNYWFDEAAYRKTADTKLGKKILLTTRQNWKSDDIIAAYHNQFVIEDVFKNMKQRTTGSWWPLHHWTDQKIHVHALYCTIAVLIRSLLHKKVTSAGINVSMARMLKELDGIQEVVNVYKNPSGRKGKKKTVLTGFNPVQKKLSDLLQLEKIR